MKKSIYFLAVLLALALSLSLSYASAQQKELKGVVKGECLEHSGHYDPLNKATVMWLGTNIGVLTSADGKFAIALHETSNKLVVSYTGYLKDTIEIKKGDNNIEVVLKASFTTDDIQVIGRQPSQLISKSDIGKTEILTQRTLMKAACCNLSESFQTNPSVDVNYTDAVTGAKQIELLGLHGAYSQLMTEKIPNLRGIAAPFGLGYIPGPWMQSIQISKGAASVSNGFESITGQINVEYKKPREGEPLHLNLYANQEGKLEANMNSAIRISEEVSSAILLHGDFFNNQIDNNRDGFLDHPMSNQFNLLNRWEYVDESIHSQAGVKAIIENRKGGQKNFFPNRSENLYGIDIETERYEVFAKNGVVLDQEHFKSLGFIANFASHRQDALFGKSNYSAKQNTLYLNLIYESEIARDLARGSIGLSYIRDDYDERFRTYDLSRVENIPGAYAELTLEPNEHFQATAGFRADFHNLYGNFYSPRIHIKYEIIHGLTFRGSAGKGYRIANVFADNLGLMASSREFIISNDLQPEEAWNYGINATYDFEMFGLPFTLNAEFYRTDFENQVIADIDKDYQFAYFDNLNGKSYSNSFQIDLSFELFDGLELFAAYRMNDVHSATNGKLQHKALQSPSKSFLNIAYSAPGDEWRFDFTASYASGGRMPNSLPEIEGRRLPSEFEGYFILQGQITKIFGDFEIYLGGENLTDYLQPYPVIGYEKPFDSGFDSSLIWGPISGRKIYLGMRYNIR